MKRGFAAFVLALAANAAGAAPAGDEEARYQALISELRCLVCQNQTIAESSAPLAADLRAQVRSQIASGRSDAQIVDYLTDRYGDFVRYRPAFKAQTWLLWLGPFVLLLGAAITALLVIRRSRKTLAAADPAAVQKLLDETRNPP